jgi:hypothetical protein
VTARYNINLQSVFGLFKINGQETFWRETHYVSRLSMKLDFNALVLTNLAPLANKTRHRIPQKKCKKTGHHKNVMTCPHH